MDLYYSTIKVNSRRQKVKQESIDLYNLTMKNIDQFIKILNIIGIRIIW